MDQGNQHLFEKTPEATFMSTYGRVFFLGLFSLALCSFPPFAFFAAVPLVISLILFGVRNSSLVWSTLGIISLIVFKMMGEFPYITTLYVGAVFVAGLIFYFMRKGHSPVRIVILLGSLLVVLGLLFIALFKSVTHISIYDETFKLVVASIEKFKVDHQKDLEKATDATLELKRILENPRSLTDEIFGWIPSMFFISVFTSIWITLLLVLRNVAVWKSKFKYPYTTDSLMQFKAPESFVWPLIIGLVLLVGGKYISPVYGEPLEVLGVNLLYCLGVFYFFEGVGIYIDFLKSLRIHGGLRSLLLILMIMTAWKILVIGGIFNMWFDFRKFFKPKRLTEQNKD